MEKIRKRSFTNYQNSPILQEELLNEVFQQQNTEKFQAQNPENTKCQKSLSLVRINSKKAKIFNKFQKFHNKTSRNSTQNNNVSTIQSLKRQIVALQCDDVLSYRLHSIQDETTVQETSRQNQNMSQIEAMIAKFRNLKKQTMADKFRKKFIQFKSTKIKASPKTQRSSIKNQCLTTRNPKSQIILFKKDDKKKVQSSGQKVLQRREQYFCSKSKSNMSLTARRFYDKKPSHTRTQTQTSLGIYQREKSIKKMRIDDRVFSRSVLSL